MTKAQIDATFARLSEQMPEPETELNYVNTYTLLVAVALSAQSTDVGVNKATKTLFETVQTPKQMLSLGEAGLKEHIKTIGLYNSKAKNVMAAAKILQDEHSGAVPEDREALEALPGVGRKTANVILNIAFGHETCAVDTHIFRVANRMNFAPGKTPLAVEKALMKKVPPPYRRHAHHWLILHGRYTCKARTPLCGKCRVFDYCGFKDKAKFFPKDASATG
ncbi:MAG: endonuclease III [Pseudomonadota bacterium]